MSTSVTVVPFSRSLGNPDYVLSRAQRRVLALRDVVTTCRQVGKGVQLAAPWVASPSSRPKPPDCQAVPGTLQGPFRSTRLIRPVVMQDIAMTTSTSSTMSLGDPG